jgi:formylglycine-generating enzyme required for sulfatase activity
MLYSAARAVDQSGNVWEWTADAYAPDAYKNCGPACTDPKEPAADGGSVLLRVRRGGSYRSAQFKELRTHARDFHTPELARSDDNGVRCAFDAVLPP